MSHQLPYRGGQTFYSALKKCTFCDNLHFFYAIYCVFHKKALPLRQITE